MTFTLTADFREFDGDPDLTKKVRISANTQVIGDDGEIFGTIDALTVTNGTFTVELPDNTTNPGEFGYIVKREYGQTKVWHVPAQDPGAEVSLADFTATTPLPVPTPDVYVQTVAGLHGIVGAQALVDALGTPLSGAIEAAVDGLGGGQQRQRVEDFRGFVASGGITVARPFVALGDSHTDETTSAHFLWDRLRDIRTGSGEGLEGVDPDAIQAFGHNGISPVAYKAAGYLQSEVLSATPSTVMACLGVNGVRDGTYGTTVAQIRVNLADDLEELYAEAQEDDAAPDYWIWRVPAPFTTTDSSGLLSIDPQIATDGIRAAYYELIRRLPASLIYDVQTRVFGTACPATDDWYYGNDIHQNQRGYEREGDDFALWVGAAQPFLSALSRQAANTNAVKPWEFYPRDVEDENRYVLIATYLFNEVGSAGGTPKPYLRLETTGDVAANDGYASGLGYVVPGQVTQFDLVHIPDVGTYQIPNDATIGMNGANLQIGDFVGLPTGFTGGKKTIKIYRRRTVDDVVVGKAIDDTSPRFKGILIWAGDGGDNTKGYLISASVTTQRAVVPAGELVAQVDTGDKLVIQGGLSLTVGTDVTLAAVGDYMQISIASADRSTWNGRMAVVYGNHAP